MLLMIQLLAAVGTAQPAQPQVEFAECRTGVFVRSGQPCPPIGPHPLRLFFDWDQVLLSGGARLALDGLAEAAKRNPRAADWAYLVEAHADRSGPALYNRDLSRRRAEAVRDYLVSRGLPANAIGVTYFGEERPAVGTADGAAEPDNRRAVITIVEPE